MTGDALHVHSWLSAPPTIQCFSSMGHILGVGYPLKIIRAAVGLNSILVINVRSVWVWLKKSFRDQPVDQRGASVQGDSVVAHCSQMRLEQAVWKRPIDTHVTPDSPEVRDGEFSFKSHHGMPLLVGQRDSDLDGIDRMFPSPAIASAGLAMRFAPTAAVRVDSEVRKWPHVVTTRALFQSADNFLRVTHWFAALTAVLGKPYSAGVKTRHVLFFSALRAPFYLAYDVFGWHVHSDSVNVLTRPVHSLKRVFGPFCILPPLEAACRH